MKRRALPLSYGSDSDPGGSAEPVGFEPTTTRVTACSSIGIRLRCFRDPQTADKSDGDKLQNGVVVDIAFGSCGSGFAEPMTAGDPQPLNPDGGDFIDPVILTETPCSNLGNQLKHVITEPANIDNL